MKVSRGSATARSRYSAGVLEACDAASNCQVSDGPFGLSIGFVPGEEPGSTNYTRRFAKRFDPSVGMSVIEARDESGMHTKALMGDKLINYGSYEPWDAIEQVKQACYETSCLTASPVTLDTKIISASCDTSAKLVLKPSGQYHDLDERNNYFEAAKAAVARGIQEKPQTYTGPIQKDGISCILKATEHHQSGFVSVTKWDGKDLQGFLSIEVQAKEEGGDCDRILGIAESVGGAISGLAGGFFGLASLACPKN
ncbi:MAG: hypothetical protein M1816_002186 [Peltula sp. TS41687]|nr:MAG: hypothetical protein M1816_002186 [Peltula sp. TS41687]